MREQRDTRLLSTPKGRKKVRRVFYVLLLLLLIADFFVHKHGHFSWEEAPEFFAVFGFLGCILLVLIAALLRPIVRRKEDHYD